MIFIYSLSKYIKKTNCYIFFDSICGGRCIMKFDFDDFKNFKSDFIFSNSKDFYLCEKLKKI